MALDAVAVKCLTGEINKAVTGGRIDKIHQPERDEIVLGIRTYAEHFKLVLSAGSAHPRVHFTEVQKQNPITAPMFCMLLRKHLGGSKITAVRQAGFERIIVFDAEGYDELGDVTTRHLIVEIMGRHSNIILTNESMKIIDCIKHVDFSVSSVRQVLPGLQYEFPPEQDKLPLIEFKGHLKYEGTGGEQLSKLLISQISGISPLTARELIFNAYGCADMKLSELKNTEPLEKAVRDMAENVTENRFTPCIIKDDGAMRIMEFSAIDIRQYGGLMKVEYTDSMNRALDDFYSGRDALERMKQKSAGVTKLLNTLLERAYKKRIILTKTVADAGKKEQYKIYGDLITANMYNIPEGAPSAEVQNYYDPQGGVVRITLDPSLTPSANAQRYYKKYQKAKTAEVEAAQQSRLNDQTIEYLESTLAAVENCTGEADINAIRTELAGEGYIKRGRDKKNRKAAESKPMHFISEDGFDIYVGKNNTQNDYLTLKLANSGDLWFHTKAIHGSHTIIKLGVDKKVPETTIRQAAELAAYYSKGRDSNQVPVDYTQVKNVKKPNGAKPGMVIYDNYNTLYVKPKYYESR